MTQQTILVVDDEPDVVQSVKDLLRLEFRVLGARGAAEGIALLDQEPVAVVLTDQRMPGTTGVEFLKVARAQHPDIARLLFTGHADVRAVIDAINLGNVYRYIAKPWNPEELLGIVRDAARLHELVVEGAALLKSLTAANADLRVTRDELVRSEAKYKLLFDRNPNPMWVTEAATGRFLAVNEEAVQQYNYSREAFLSMCLRDLEVDATRDPSTPDRYRGRHRKADGAVIDVEVSVEPIEFEAADSQLALVRDVTLQHRLEEHFHRNQKMDALGLMAGGIAHDFGNVMATVMLASGALVSGLPPGSPMRGMAEEIRSHAERGATLTRQLLSFSRGQPGTVIGLNLSQVLLDLEPMIRRVLGPEVELTLTGAPDVPEVVADRAQIDQVILNLVVNARDATGGRGHVEISTRPLELDGDRSPEYATLAPGRYMVLAVTDDGHGIDAATQARIFEPFFTTKNEGRGTGLGLATVFSIVRQHRGDIRVESAPGRGARFEVFFPLR